MKTGPSILICLDMFVAIIKIYILILALIFPTWIAEENWENLWKPLRNCFKALRDLVAYPTSCAIRRHLEL